MNFRTEVFPKDLNNKISHESKVLSLGSCFSVNIGEKLNDCGIQTSNNPLGTIFNPISLFRLIENITAQKALSKDLFVSQNDLFLHHDLHSQFSASSQNELENNFEKISQTAAKELKEASHIIITLGTAFSYEHIKTSAIVSNCHKTPQSNFNKRLLTVQEIKEAYNAIAPLLSGKQIILTISPVRHTHDGLEENSTSKSTLKLAVNEIVKAHENVYYFPSFEIFMDDLRDYRFYKEDLIHPNKSGIHYVWEKFQNIAFDEKTQVLNEKVNKLKSALKHKAFNPNSEEHLQFLKSTLAKAKDLNDVVNLIPEIKEIESRINEFR